MPAEAFNRRAPCVVAGAHHVGAQLRQLLPRRFRPAVCRYQRVNRDDPMAQVVG